MQVRAKISKGYRARLGILSAVLVFMGAYFLYDWKIGYPKQREIALTYEDIFATEDNPQQAWVEIATENGWSTEAPGKPKTQSDINTQLYCGIACALIAAPFVLGFLRAGGRWVQVDENGLSASGGRQAAWSQIDRVDNRKWKSKGIAWVYFKDRQGDEDRILLDDWKFEVEPTRQIYAQVEAHMGMNEEQTAQPDETSAETETSST